MNRVVVGEAVREGGKEGMECGLGSKWRIEGLFQIPTPSCLRLSGSLQVLWFLGFLISILAVCVLADRGQAAYWGISYPGSMPAEWVVQVPTAMVWFLAKLQLLSRALMLPSALKVWALLVQCNCSHHLRMSLGSETLSDIKRKKSYSLILWAVVSSPGEQAVKVVSAG